MKRYHYHFVFLGLFIISICLFGLYYEETEALAAAFIQGIYSDPLLKDYDEDFNFLLIAAYSYINQLFPNYQIYPVFLIVINMIVYTFLGVLLLSYLKKAQFKQTNLFIYLISFFILMISATINVCTTRLVFMAFATLLLFQHSTRFKCTVSFVLVLYFLSLMRMDAVILSSIIYILYIILFDKLSYKTFLPFLISLSVFIAYNILLSTSDREAKKVFYYKEFDLVDRNSKAVATLSSEDKVIFDLYIDYNIMDDEMFKLDFIDKVIGEKKGTFLFSNLFDLTGYYNTVLNSLDSIYNSIYIVIYALILLILYLSLISFNINLFFNYIFLLLFPLLVCFIIIIPERFVEPYYLFFSLFLLYQMLLKVKNIPIVYPFLLCLNVFLIIHYCNYKIEKSQFVREYKKYLIELKSLESRYINKTIVFESFMHQFHYPSPIDKVEKSSVIFLNMSFYNSFKGYQSKWKDVCKCDPLSIKEKLLFLSNTESIFIMEPYLKDVYEKYMLKRHHLKIDFREKGPFYEGLYIYTVNMGNNETTKNN